jgi:hypothetical protein
MVFSIKQFNGAEEGGGVNPWTSTFSSAQIKGNLNVVCVAWYDTVGTITISSVTDVSGNKYYKCPGSDANISGGPATVEMWYASNIKAATAGTNIVSVNLNSGSTDMAAVIMEVGGGANSFDLASANSGTLSSGTIITGNTINTNYSVEILIGFSANSNTNITAVGSGWINLYSPVTSGPAASMWAYQLVNVKGAYAASATTTATNNWCLCIGGFYLGPTPNDPIFFGMT